MSDTDLVYLPATAALKLFAKKKLSPVDLMQATIARAEAMDLARKAEANYAKGRRTAALEGLPNHRPEL